MLLQAGQHLLVVAACHSGSKLLDALRAAHVTDQAMADGWALGPLLQLSCSSRACKLALSGVALLHSVQQPHAPASEFRATSTTLWPVASSASQVSLPMPLFAPEQPTQLRDCSASSTAGILRACDQDERVAQLLSSLADHGVCVRQQAAPEASTSESRIYRSAECAGAALGHAVALDCLLCETVHGSSWQCARLCALA